MDTRAAADARVNAWTRGWEAGDPAPIAALYAEDAIFRSHPFREPEPSADAYVERAFADESLVECLFGEPIVDRDRAAVEYWAILGTPRGEETLAGVTLLRFGPDGRVVEHRDYWSMQAGRTPPRSDRGVPLRYFAYSIARDSRITVTLIWPG
jgi:SnoaL-like domain